MVVGVSGVCEILFLLFAHAIGKMFSVDND
jgi:hypothetical protein